MAKREPKRSRASKTQARTIVVLPATQEAQLDEFCARYEMTKTAVIRRALNWFFNLDAAVQAGGEVQVALASGERKSLLFP